MNIGYLPRTKVNELTAPCAQQAHNAVAGQDAAVLSTQRAKAADDAARETAFQAFQQANTAPFYGIADKLASTGLPGMLGALANAVPVLQLMAQRAQDENNPTLAQTVQGILSAVQGAHDAITAEIAMVAAQRTALQSAVQALETAIKPALITPTFAEWLACQTGSTPWEQLPESEQQLEWGLAQQIILVFCGQIGINLQ